MHCRSTLQCWAAAGSEGSSTGQLHKRLYDRSEGQAASYKRPRLLGGDPLAKVRLAQKAEQGITDERGHEQDNVSIFFLSFGQDTQT